MDIRILTNLELDHPETQFINQKLHTLFTSRSLMSISQMRSTVRYKEMLKEERNKRNAAISTTYVTRGSNTTSMPLNTDTDLTLSLQEVTSDLLEAGITNEALAKNLVSAPLLSSDLQNIYRAFGVKIKNKSKSKKEKNKSIPDKDYRKSRRRRKFREHQRLFKLGPKVLLQELQKN